MEIVLTNNEEDLDICAEMMYGMAPWNMLQFSLPDCRKAFNGSFKENYIVKENGVILGFAILQVQGAFSGYIQSIAIAPAHHNRQLGSKLISFCEERIFRDMPNVFLCVSSFNDAAQRFYYRNGYEKVGEMKDLLVRGYDDYLLRKTKGPKAEFTAQG
jgi:[ribosomal protein S18]-alanine N-acetyltransferase